MESYKISQDQILRAQKLYTFKNLKGSITKGKSQIYGALGEIVIFDIYTKKGLEVSFESTYDYDLIISNYKVDVKTKKTTVVPQPHYLCSITDFNPNQKCDFYFFLRIHENQQECFLLGYKSKADFFQQCFFSKKGSLDINGWSFKDDCYNIKIEMLDKFKIST